MERQGPAVDRGQTEQTEESDIEFRARARVGTWLKDKYRLDRVIGSGGMAVVYAATHRNQAEFAVKMLHRELSLNQDVRTRFLREGYAANSVKHRGAVRVVDDDVAEDGAAFLVMELLQGVLVEELWTRSGQRLDPRTVLNIGYQVLDVLEAAHARKVVHRDIKPANIFLTQDGVVKVLDFGIARLRDVALGDGKGTQTGLMMGTPAFMAPEQAMARPNEIDAQTDLWAVGATLFTLISGQLVHEGENAQQLLIRAATTPARSLLSVAPDVPPAIAQVIDAALGFEKTARWPDAASMREALREVCVATYGDAPARKQLLGVLGDDAASPDSTQRMLSVPQSGVRSGPPSAAEGVTSGSGYQDSASPRPNPSGPALPYRPSTQLTSSSAAEHPVTPRSGPSVGVMLAIGAGAFALAFGIGLALHTFRPGLINGLTNPPAPLPHAATSTVVVTPPAQPSATSSGLLGGHPQTPGVLAGQAPTALAPGSSGDTARPPGETVAPGASAAASAPSAAPSAAPAASASAAKVARPTRHYAPPPAEAAKPAPAADSTPAETAPKVDCTVPYTLDSDGNKKWKMECLGH